MRRHRRPVDRAAVALFASSPGAERRPRRPPPLRRPLTGGRHLGAAERARPAACGGGGGLERRALPDLRGGTQPEGRRFSASRSLARADARPLAHALRALRQPRRRTGNPWRPPLAPQPGGQARGSLAWRPAPGPQPAPSFPSLQRDKTGIRSALSRPSPAPTGRKGCPLGDRPRPPGARARAPPGAAATDQRGILFAMLWRGRASSVRPRGGAAQGATRTPSTSPEHPVFAGGRAAGSRPRGTGLASLAAAYKRGLGDRSDARLAAVGASPPERQEKETALRDVAEIRRGSWRGRAAAALRIAGALDPPLPGRDRAAPPLDYRVAMAPYDPLPDVPLYTPGPS
jgi:hypothetical protein